MRNPTKLFKEDPEENRSAEWCEISYARSVRGGWRLVEEHGYGDAAPSTRDDGRAWGTEGEASTGLDTRIEELVNDGFTHRFVLTFDQATSAMVFRKTF